MLVVEDYNITLNNTDTWHDMLSNITGSVVSGNNVIGCSVVSPGIGIKGVTLSGNKSQLYVGFESVATGTYKISIVFFYK